jgi:hypothetical protein
VGNGVDPDYWSKPHPQPEHNWTDFYPPPQKTADPLDGLYGPAPAPTPGSLRPYDPTPAQVSASGLPPVVIVAIAIVVALCIGLIGGFLFGRRR